MAARYLGAGAGRGRAGVVRGLRAVPAALPDVPGHGRGGAVAAGPDRRHARRAVARAPVDDDFVRFMETCVQCRGCEPACPSGVPFGHLMEDTRDALARADRTAPRWLRARLRRPRPPPAAPRRLDGAGAGPAAAPRPAPPRPRAAARGGVADPSPAPATDVWLFTGCVMDAWMRPTHRDTAELLTAAGATFAVPGAGGVVLRRPARPRRPARRRPPAGPAGDRRRCPATLPSSSTRPAAERR